MSGGYCIRYDNGAYTRKSASKHGRRKKTGLYAAVILLSLLILTVVMPTEVRKWVLPGDNTVFIAAVMCLREHLSANGDWIAAVTAFCQTVLYGY